MKTIYMVLLGAMVLFTFANCGKKDDKKAALDMSAECYNRAVVANTTQTYYGQQQYPGAPCSYNWSALQSYGFSTAQSSGSWGYASGGGVSCSYGEVVYSPTKGPGCVQTQQMGNILAAKYVLDGPRGVFVLANAPNPAAYYQQSYQYQQPYINGVTVLRSCDESEPCPGGQRCAPSSGMPGSPSPIGICAF